MSPNGLCLTVSHSVDDALMPVVEALSDALETPVEELPPLSEEISLDGLQAVMNHSGSEDVTVTFPYAGLRVFVHSRGIVYVRPLAGPGASEERFVHQR